MKRENRCFHVVCRAVTAKKCEKSVMQVQTFYFANVNLLLVIACNCLFDVLVAVAVAVIGS